ncbi:class I SAM-dependent methyltransferase [Phenylobacterium sp.]|uniref:class I SAM-dependent methyltransferase n=1 Tax=Phenylobacterium sp. TaxID=1871053 RepID=UPI0025D07268|nr:class I SAM-dependent methyltransferase [Phenylobacterium sp.]
MSAFERYFADPEFVARYVEQGPPAFMPGHAGVLQMVGVLLAETTPVDGVVLVVGAGGGLDTRALAQMEAGWRFVGVDPSAKMLDLARSVLGEAASGRVQLIEGTVSDAPEGPFDAATLILVLGMIPDDGSKLTLLREIRRRLRPGAPFVLVDRCDDREGTDFRRNIDRYAAYARASGVAPETVAGAYESQKANPGLVTAARNEALLAEAGFAGLEPFYRGMEWRGWVAYASA